MDRERLADPKGGVAYLKKTLRPFFVKGAEAIFLWRFMMTLTMKRGHTDYMPWITRFMIARQRLTEAWSDLHTPTETIDGPDGRDATQEIRVVRQAEQDQ